MIRMTQSLKTWLFMNYPKELPLIGLGHVELLTQEMWDDYIKWVQTDEGKQYLKGGSKYDPNLDPTLKTGE